MKSKNRCRDGRDAADPRRRRRDEPASRAPFGTTSDGRAVGIFTLEGASGLRAEVLEWGAVLRSLHVPDRAGRRDDVVLGHDTLEGYLHDRVFLGAVVGRYANRIRGGRFTLDGTTHELPRNDGPNHLHGGPRGFYKVLWKGEPVRTPEGPGVRLRYTSPDGEQGYPGTLAVTVTYVLSDAGALVVDFHATTDRATPVNLAQHAYLDLAGGGGGSVLDHELLLHADAYTPVDETGIPLGTVEPVRGTPFDFTAPRRLGERIDADHPQLRIGRGYDHNFVLRGARGTLRPAARVVEPRSGRVLEVLTTEPGLQLYTGNHLDGAVGKGGRVHAPRTGFCLETQHFPDSPNRPAFPSTILRPGEALRSRTELRFGVAG